MPIEIQKAVRSGVYIEEGKDEYQNSYKGTLNSLRTLILRYKLKNDTLTEKLAYYDELQKQTQQLAEVNRHIEQQSKELSVLRQQKTGTQRAEMKTAHNEGVKRMEAAHQAELKRADEKRIAELERFSEKSKLEIEKTVLATRSELQEKHQGGHGRPHKGSVDAI